MCYGILYFHLPFLSLFFCRPKGKLAFHALNVAITIFIKTITVTVLRQGFSNGGMSNPQKSQSREEESPSLRNPVHKKAEDG